MKRCVSLCVYWTAVIVIVCYDVTILKCYWPAPTSLELTIYMLSKELATVCTCTLVLQIAGTFEQTEVEGSGGGLNVGVLGQPLSLPPGLHAALPSHGETTPAPPTPTERKRLERQSQPPPHRPRALPVCITVLGPGVLDNLDVVRGHRPLLLTVSTALFWYPGSHLGQWGTHLNMFSLYFRHARRKWLSLKLSTMSWGTWKPGQQGPWIWSSSTGWGASTRCPPWW